jgi:PIN domain nuclease of toxin-antitoxin system
MRSLDSSAVIAVIHGEPGADRVTRHLKRGLLSTANHVEVVGMLLRQGSTPEDTRAVLAELPIRLVSLDEELAFRTGALEPATRRAGLSLGDRACLALAQRFGVPARTGGRRWLEVTGDPGIEIELIR